MKAFSPYAFIHIGLIIRLLRHSKGFTIKAIIEEASRLAKNLNEAGFLVSIEGLDDLQGFINKLESDSNIERQIIESEIYELSEIMNVVEKMVFAESQTKKVYVLTERRFSLDCLLYHPERMFKKDVFKKLPKLARIDLVEGFICILLSMSTAAAFHILRATEGILRSYYIIKVKRGREKQPLWGNMLKGLQAKKKQNENLLNRLQYIKDTYRNPTSHPEAVYSLEEAQDLLGICIDVINSMADELPELTEKSAT
jgi:hypothetical protein